MAEDDLYHRDFFRWTRDQAARLRTLAQRQSEHGRDPDSASDGVLDAGHLAEEVAQAGRSELNRVAAHLTNTLVCLLEAAWLEDAATNRRWRGEAKSTAREARRAFTDGMRPYLDIQEIWEDALDETNARLRDTGEQMLPARLSCPLTLDDLLARRMDADAAVDRLRAALLDDDAEPAGREG
ncbi:DUF29 family protein [Rhodovibrio sodomensis]|nr:DUF29 family protein [Rhodovibrio sodomensis]